jgi:hypothetical protein
METLCGSATASTSAMVVHSCILAIVFSHSALAL